ncbi:MAG: hypothetical protein K1X68_02605 [Saprospiraceae bacterium]|nr:hypothetical protein [Saprospiraceae bacterium]HMX89570.1 hypothetical protein [Saprospiraceae bacterium]HMZ41076.1 hypothetical protein [Saprospiraceae bacterium]HNB31566.1 hypothetical protein [Saprospiraceae bacterium]HNC36922.1 hypothetical protein [Saprospiraceae bacterium]
MAFLYKVIFGIAFLTYWYRCLVNKDIRLRWPYALLYSTAFIFEGIVLTFCSIVYKDNTVLYNLYAFIMVAIYWLCFDLKLLAGSRWLYLIYSFFLLEFCYILFIAKSPESRLYVANLTVIILLLLIKYRQKLDYQELASWDRQELFVGLGILLFYVSSFPLLVFYNLLIGNQDVKHAYNLLLKVGNVFLSLGYLASVLCLKKEE